MCTKKPIKLFVLAFVIAVVASVLVVTYSARNSRHRDAILDSIDRLDSIGVTLYEKGWPKTIVIHKEDENFKTLHKYLISTMQKKSKRSFVAYVPNVVLESALIKINVGTRVTIVSTRRVADGMWRQRKVDSTPGDLLVLELVKDLFVVE